ncbi:MAG TPA: hypothetical protein EYP46_00200 [Hadesarchaea archaeon]|nr:hypothetical protein [Hadesarchaea archaeon]
MASTIFRKSISSPSNIDLVQKILNHLEIPCRRKYSARFGTENVIMRMNEAYSSPTYNPWVMSYRFMELNDMVKAKRYAHKNTRPSWLRKEIVRLVEAKKEAREIFDTLLEIVRAKR